MSQGDQHSERDIFNIGSVAGDVQVINRGRRERSRQERDFLGEMKRQVTGRLKKSLHNAVLLHLGKESQPEKVKNPLDAEIKIGSQPAEPLPSEIGILEVFDRPDIAGRLLILGNPGAGKTTTLLELAEALGDRAEQQPEFPIPVMFNLSAWQDDKQSMRDWLVAELRLKGVPAKIGSKWLNDRRILPLLDGLDEVRADRQERCVQTINQLLAGENPPLYLVVCSRREEYDAYKTRLELSGAICLQTLTLEQIQDYLVRVNRPELWQVMSHDANLLDIVQAPLFLNVAILAYPDAASLEQWRRLNTTQERLQDLWDRYICRMFEREIDTKLYGKRKAPSQQQARHWLIWLAQQLQREVETEFLIEKLQPTCLLGRQQWAYRLIFGLMLGLIIGLTSGLIEGPIGALINGLIGGLIFGLMFGLLGEVGRIKPVEVIKISIARMVHQKTLRVLKGNIILGLIFGLILIPTTGLTSGLILGLIFVPTIGLIFGLIVESKTNIQVRTKANQGIKNSFKNFILISAILLLLALALSILAQQMLSHSVDSKVAFRILTFPFFGWIWVSFLAGGGLACIQHFALRLVLFRSSSAPWNYARFLDYASERLLLQRIGGQYRFMHKLLQDHFAAMPLHSGKLRL